MTQSSTTEMSKMAADIASKSGSLAYILHTEDPAREKRRQIKALCAPNPTGESSTNRLLTFTVA